MGETMAKTFQERIHERAARHDPKYTLWEDKLEGYRIARENQVQTPEVYQVCRRGSEIDFSRLPRRYVVKPNHLALGLGVLALDRGLNLLDGRRYDEAAIRALMDEMMAKVYDAESAQQHIDRRILVEELLRPEGGSKRLPDDYKCYVFAGRVELIEVIRQRDLSLLRRLVSRERRGLRVNFLTRDWEPVRENILIEEPIRGPVPFPPPRCLPELIAAAERLGKAFGEFLRVDLYPTDKGPVLGEFTLHPYGGRFFSDYGNRLLGELWEATA